MEEIMVEQKKKKEQVAFEESRLSIKAIRVK